MPTSRSLLLAVTASVLLCVPGAAGATVPVPASSGPEGSSSMHGDTLNSDTTPYAGPGATARRGVATTLPAVCPTILAGRDGLVQALCTDYSDRAPVLRLVDPASGTVLASHRMAKGSTLGGVYAFVDSRDRLVTVDGDLGVVALAHRRTGKGWAITVDRAFPVAGLMTRACGAPGCDAVVSVSPGYDGRTWFATANGRAGYVSSRGSALRTLGSGETVANSIATAPQGVAVTTDHAQYLVRADSHGTVRTVWRRAYDRGPARKPGQLSRGSGTSPTFFGPRTGSEYLVIADNAAPREHLVVYRTTDGATVCTAPVLSPTGSGTENSPIAWKDRVYLASTYGYTYPPTAAAGQSDPVAAPFTGGMQAFTVTPSGRCRADWTNDVASSAVPKLSRRENVLYTVERSAQGLVWQVVRLDPRTGRRLSSTSLGAGPQSDTLQMVGTFLPDGTLLQGTISGFVTVRPAA